MNEKERRSKPEDQNPARAQQPGAADVPSRERKAEQEATRSAAGESSGLEATMGMNPTESFAERPAKADAAKDSVPQAATKPAAPKEGKIIAGRFLVRRLLGQGGMGRVYAVLDKQIEGRDVALKVLLPKYSKNAQFRKLFFGEVRAAQGFVSEYICQVRDTGETEDGSLFLTMDLIEGESLRAQLDRDKVLGARQALEITRQVLLGLQSGHEKGFVHRDIKPPNVMMVSAVPKTDDNPYGVAARLLDFGIAGLASEIDERSRAGTVMYMSPEQASGERLDPRSDLFAVGVLLFEMLSGHRPFEGSTTRALVQSVLETNLTARLSEIPNLSKPVRKILERALQKDRDKRFQSAGEFAEAVTSSAAYKLPKEVPVWAYAGLGVLFVAASAEAFVLSQKSGEVDGLNKQISAAQAEQLTAVQKAKDIKDQEIRGKEALLAEQVVKSDKLLGERDEWKNKYAAVDAQRIEIQGKYDTNVADAASKSTDKSQWDEQIADLKGQLQSERDAKSSLSERLGKLEDSEKTWKERASTAERARDEALKAASPQGQLAMTFDRICELAEKDLGQQALKTLLSAQDGGVFAKAGVDGADTVASLAQAAARVHTYHEALRSGGTAVLRDMVEARRFLDTAEKGGPSFALEAAGWIDFQFAGQEMQDRPKRALALSTRLKQDVGNALAASAKEDSADAAAIDLSKLASDASAIFAHEDKFACKDHLSRAAGVLVDQLRQQAAPGNVLDVERLRTFKTLPEFTQRLRQAQFALDASKTADLYAFEFAQRWYGEFNPTEKLEWNFAPPAVPSAPTSDWRSVMYLQWQLAGDKSNLPIKLGRSLLYRYSEPKKTPTWTRVSCRGSSRFVVEYQAYDDAGFQVGTADEREFEYVDGALRVKGSEVPIVDLHARGPSFSVVPFPVQSAELAIPSTLASEAELHKFREFLKAHPQACLAVKETGKDRWFSPEFGLVFDEIQGGLRRDLVSSTGVQ